MMRSSFMMRSVFAVLLLCATFKPAPALAQMGMGVGLGAASAGWWAPGGYGYGGGYGGLGQNPAGAYLQGMGNVIRSYGVADELHSQAAINYTQAQSAYIDNQKKWVDTYQQARKESRERLAEQEARDNELRDKYLANRQSGFPPRLTPSQLDPATGQIVWPVALRAPQFAESRKKIEELVLLRTFTSRTEELASQLHAAARAMQNELKSIIRDVPANEYIEARKFLDSMAFEGRYPPGSNEVSSK